ncbi:MAG: response regulator [Candidatus Hodarchaeales archaeon]
MTNALNFMKLNLELTKKLIAILEESRDKVQSDIDSVLRKVEDFFKEKTEIIDFYIKKKDKQFDIEISSFVLPVSYLHQTLVCFFELFSYSYSKIVKTDDSYILRFDKKSDKNLIPVKICILDDNEDFLDLITRFIKSKIDSKYNFQVFTTTEPEMFQSYLVIEKGDVLIVDEKFPGSHSGLEILKQLKSSSPDSIKILITGYPEFSLAQEAINHSYIDLFISKPVKRDDFINLLCQELDEKYKPV